MHLINMCKNGSPSAIFDLNEKDLQRTACDDLNYKPDQHI